MNKAAKRTIEDRLTGGHPNSLGETIAVAEDVLSDGSKQLFLELCDTYNSADEVVRLRVSSALKRVCGLHADSLSPNVHPRPEWILERFDWLIDDIGRNLDQPSAKWSIAQIVQKLQPEVTEKQLAKATDLLKHNLETENDWIVQNMTVDILSDLALKDGTVRQWLIPMLKKMQKDERKSVSAKATKLVKKLSV